MYGIKNEYDAAFFINLAKTVNSPDFVPKGGVRKSIEPVTWKKVDTSFDLSEILIESTPLEMAVGKVVMEFLNPKIQRDLEDQLLSALAGYCF